MVMLRWTLTLVLLATTVLWSGSVWADEPIFGFIMTTDLLPKGKWEVEQWMTLREQKAYREFHLVEGRTELSYGATDAIQLSLYANYNWTEAFHNSVDHTTAPPESFAERNVGPDQHFQASKFVGGSLEGIFRLLSPYTDPIGLAILLEPTIGHKFVEMETRLILQKNFLDDRLVIAFNATLAQELRKLPGDKTAEAGSTEASAHWDRETDVNFGLAAGYRFTRNWTAGFEVQNEREFSDFTFWEGKFANHVAWYAGPTLHYGGKHFFATLTFLEQLPLGEDHTRPPQGVILNNRTYADDFERYRFRLKVGYYF